MGADVAVVVLRTKALDPKANGRFVYRVASVKGAANLVDPAVPQQDKEHQIGLVFEHIPPNHDEAVAMRVAGELHQKIAFLEPVDPICLNWDGPYLARSDRERALHAAREDLAAKEAALGGAQDRVLALAPQAGAAVNTWAGAVVRSDQSPSFMDNWDAITASEDELREARTECGRLLQERDASAERLRQAWAAYHQA